MKEDEDRPRSQQSAPGAADPPTLALDAETVVGRPAGDDPGIAEAEPPTTDRYSLGEVLGEGGMGVVRLATDTRLRRPVAVKLLRSELAGREDVRRRFFDEAEILAGLDHPGATPIFELGRLPEGELFYAMKRVRGRTLRDLLADRTAADIRSRQVEAHFVDVFERVCQTVAAAHDQGVIHRDLKPENVMVDEGGGVYVMDWGLAKRLEPDEADAVGGAERTALGVVMGTPAYMSPEQAAGQSADTDRQADVFSLGIMLYEILSGLNPFARGSARESMKGVMHHEPDPPRKRNPRVSRALSAVCMKALAKDPFRRYASARELADDVRSYREFRPVSAAPPRLGERLANWSRRRPRLATLLATLSLVIVASGLGTALHASVENARVAEAYATIDQVEARLAALGAEIDALTGSLAQESDPERRAAIERRLAVHRAEQASAEKTRRVVALAITGFTFFSPDKRAVDIVRESMLDDIRSYIEAGDHYRARAEITLAMSFADRRNLFGLDEDEYEALQRHLEAVEREIDERERPGRPEADRPAP